MVPILLALAVGAGASPVPAFAQHLCPTSTAEAESCEVELHRLEDARAECLRRGMEAAFAGALRGLPSVSAARWRKLEAVYGRWARDACRLSEDLFWIQLDRRLRDSGTAMGLPTSACLEGAYGERAYFAGTLSAARAGAAALQAWDVLVTSRQPVGAIVRRLLGQTLSMARADQALPPPLSVPGEEAMGPSDFEALTAEVDGVWRTAVELAERQCEAVGRSASSLCVARAEGYLFSLIDVPGGGHPPGGP